MQTNYKIVSSYEYDAISGQYKQINYQNEDYSLVNDFDFANILNATDENLNNNDFISNNDTQSSGYNSHLNNYTHMLNIYTLRFRQGENELPTAKTQNSHKDTMQEKSDEQQNNSLLKDLLNMT